MKSEKGEKYNWHVILFLPVKTMYISRFLNLTSKRGCLDWKIFGFVSFSWGIYINAEQFLNVLHKSVWIHMQGSCGMLSQESEWCSLFTFVYTCFTFKDCQGSHGHKLSTTKILLIWNNPCIHVYVWAWYSAVSNWQKIFNDEYFYSKKLTELLLCLFLS